MKVERGRSKVTVEGAKAKRGVDKMSDVHLILIFLLAPFVVVLAGLIAATRIGDPECSLGTRKSSRRAMTPPMTGSHD